MSKTAKSKTGTGKSAKRREELRRNIAKPTFSARALIQKPEYVNAGLLLLAFIIITSLLVVWSREQIKVAVDQIMLDTRLTRLDYTIEDSQATETRRQEARDSSPRVYRLNEQYIDELEHALNGLPKVVEGKTELEQISAELREEYGLTKAGLDALQPYAAEGETSGKWQDWVRGLVSYRLTRNPLLESEEYQVYSKTLHRALLSRDGRSIERLGEETRAIELTDELVPGRFEEVVTLARFPSNVAAFVQTKLTRPAKPTFVFDAVTTADIARQRADEVQPVMVDHSLGDIIYRRGDQLATTQIADLAAENQQHLANAPLAEIWLPRFGITGLIAILVAFAGGFVINTYQRILQNPVRLGALCLLMAGMLTITVGLTAYSPKLLYPAAFAPTLIAAIILLLSYDQRMALFMSTAQCALVALALQQGIGWFVLLMAGCGVMISQLREVRHRNSLIRAAIVTAAALGVGTLLLGIMTSPAAEGIWMQILVQAAWAVAASIFVGFLILGILPSIERMFDITTGMTLAELRDPSQPLLRQLQQRSPGTYNHSLQVANIAEAAADAIDADSLLVYVGALYHDIGKMNKPEYFVENQASGYNKHDKLRPALSLLIIVGHVKDGIELAREYSLPRSVQQFIDTHHGTTLVEYFYHAAKTRAETDDKASVEEVEFRHPGPKPRSKEAAILMLADVVESATRAMTEPNPSRIESLVREMSRKRLLDGQFDECDLTFRQLGLIEEAMIARLCAIHHGRISYPTTKTDEASERDTSRSKPATA